jgi:hypothetical protein
MKLLRRILLNLLTFASAVLCYQTWTVTRGWADTFNFRGEQYFYWENDGYLQVGVPGKHWHYLNAQLAIFLTALLPTCRIIMAYLRWSRKRYQAIADRAAALSKREAAIPLAVLPAQTTTHSESAPESSTPKNILNYSSEKSSPASSIPFPLISLICGLLQTACLFNAFGQLFTLYLTFAVTGIVTTILSFSTTYRMKGARILATLGAVLNFGIVLYVVRLILED